MDTSTLHPLSAPVEGGEGRLVVAPDAFKGTLGASEAARAMARGCRDAGWRGAIATCPLADGGEGTLDVLRATLPEAEWVVSRHGTWLRCRLDGRVTAIVESARLLGLGLPAMRALPVERRGSAPLGRLLRSIVDSGPRSIVVALGGTAVNDAGLGLLLALGMVVQRSGRGRPPSPDLAGLERLVRDGLGVDGLPGLATGGLDLCVLCDVDSPLAGPDGATRVFGRQKGIADDRLTAVDGAIVAFADRLEAVLGARHRDRPGAGAAGGLGFALSLLGGRLVNGADWIIERTGLAASIDGADRVLTGEGRSDHQTLAGKLPWRVAALARGAGVPVTLVSGQIDPEARPALGEAFDTLIEAPAGDGDAGAALRRAIAGSGLFDMR